MCIVKGGDLDSGNLYLNHNFCFAVCLRNDAIRIN